MFTIPSLLYPTGNNTEESYCHQNSTLGQYEPSIVKLPLRTMAYYYNCPIYIMVVGAGTGVPFHWHGPGFGEVVYGRKVSYQHKLSVLFILVHV